MSADWIRFAWSIPTESWFWPLAPMLLLDTPRYVFGSLVLWLVDTLRRCVGGHQDTSRQFEHCPSVCAVIAGLNEADTIGATLASVWGSYPLLEIIVVDDGSSDSMTEIASDFAGEHPGVIVLSKPFRGGKSSALNYALPFTDAEVIVSVDADSHLGPQAIWEIVQPFRDAQVGAVSASISARNAFGNLLTWLQAAEYRRSIFLGRMLASRLGLLGIVSGAFGAFRHSALRRLGAWDVGPGEDGDLVLRLRKSGYRITAAPYAECFTNVPTAWWTWIKQRRRWDWSVITFECRKHIDLANPLSPNFRWNDVFLVLERWIFNIVLVIAFWIGVIGLCFKCDSHTAFFLMIGYVAYVLMELLQLILILCYSVDRGRDLKIGLVTPLLPAYSLLMRAVSMWAIAEEFFLRRSFRDNFVPSHVRRATWHW